MTLAEPELRTTPQAAALPRAPAPAAAAPLVVVGLDQLIGAAHPFVHAESALSEDVADDAGLPLRYEFNWPHLNRGRHAEPALRDGCMRCIDPITGSLLVSGQGHVLTASGWLDIAHRFEGRERFHLITSSFEQAKLGLYFPDRNLLITHRVDAGRVAMAQRVAEALRDQLVLGDAVAHPDASHGKTGARPQAVTVLHLGFVNNLGHFLWNELSGLLTAIEAGWAPRIARVVCGPHTSLPIAELFPELAQAGVLVQAPAPLPAPCITYQDILPLRIAGNRLSLALRRRIVAWALAREQATLPQLAPLNGAELNLWCNLRRHNKAWLDQVEGIVELARRFAGSVPQGRPLHLILDGSPDTAELAADIAAQLQGIARVTDATRVTLSRSIVLCGLVDLHLCVVGSGLTLPHWVMGRRGVAHANRPHVIQQVFWNHVSEGTHDVDFIPIEAVNDEPTPGDADPSYANYRLDLPALFHCINPQLYQIDTGLRRSGFAQAQALSAKGRWAAAADRLLFV